jgi:hypothetical protein
MLKAVLREHHTMKSGWDALKHHFEATLCPPKHFDRLNPVWSEERARVTCANGVAEITLSAQGGYRWPRKNGEPTRVRLQLNILRKAQYFVDGESAFAWLEKKKKKLGAVKCIQTFKETSIYDGDVYVTGTDRTLYSTSQ